MELNKIHLGDAYKLIKEIPDKSVDCIYTDIPYLLQSGGKGGGHLGKRVTRIRYAELVGLDQGIDLSILDDFVRVLKNINIFIWCNKFQLLEIMNYFSKYNLVFDLLTWNKTNPIPMTDNTWLSDIEYCLYFREKKIVKLNNGYELKSKWFVSPINTNDKSEFGHPTIKPLELVKRHLLHATQENDVILDPFMGSGTTALAAKEIKRQFVGFEIDSDYHKIAVDRLNGINKGGQTSIFTDFDNL
jgi:DNA modification methylase